MKAEFISTVRSPRVSAKRMYRGASRTVGAAPRYALLRNALGANGPCIKSNP